MSRDKTHPTRSVPLSPWPAKVCLINWILLTEISQNNNWSRRRKNLNFKPVKHCLKIDLEPNPSHSEGLVNTYPIAERDKEVHTFSKDINLKVNLIVLLQFRLNHYYVTVQYINHNIMGASYSWFLSLFNGISTFMGHLIPKSSL